MDVHATQSLPVVVTGGAGFLGSHVVDSLIQRGCRVSVVDDLSFGEAKNISPYASFAGPRDCGTLTADDIPAGATIVHLAATPRCNASLFAPVTDVERNYLPGVRLLTAALNGGIRRFVYVSSMSVYGCADSPYAEDSIPQPRDPYAANKFALETVVRSECDAHGVEWVILRPQHVFGPRQRWNLTYRNVVARWIACAMQEKPLPVFASLNLERAFSPVSLIVRGIVAATIDRTATNQVFNLGTRRVRSLLELASWITRTLELPQPMFDIGPAPPTLLTSAIGRVSRAERILGITECEYEAEENLKLLGSEIARVESDLFADEQGFHAEVLPCVYEEVYRSVGRPIHDQPRHEHSMQTQRTMQQTVRTH